MTGPWTDNEKELQARISEILHYVWDPIGVAGNPHARDEYDGYIGAVWEQAKGGGDADQIASALCAMRLVMTLSGHSYLLAPLDISVL
jgi:hypothetical protein